MPAPCSTAAVRRLANVSTALGAVPVPVAASVEEPRVALVTGAGMGLGSGIALGLSAAGWKVCLTDVVANELEASGSECIAAAGSEDLVMTAIADVRSLDEMGAVVAQVEARWGGRLDLVVANAAILDARNIMDMDADAWARTIGINLSGVFHTFKAAWPLLIRQPQDTHCIAVASPAGVRGGADMTAYTASKHGVEGLMKALSAEGQPHRIAVNSMGPGIKIKPTTSPENHALIGRDARSAGLDPDTVAKAFEHGAADFESWTEPVAAAPAFEWLASQPADRFFGLRFDAGPVADMLKREGGKESEGFEEAVRELSAANSRSR
jgi:NAD(P)-dependent dehydrogenase (short-subunit alcohol dehydrogenase family)